MRWLLNTALAYNTKGICYFTYWSYVKENTGMCIDLHGNKTHKYDLVKQLNKELKFFQKYILSSAFCGYIMTGKTPNGEQPANEDRLQNFGNIRSISGGNLFVGCFDYHDGDKVKNMYIVVNNSTTENAREKIVLRNTIACTIIHRDTLQNIETDCIDVDLPAGDAYIFIEEN